ncbi:hypothetical protein ACIQ6K_34845 [Streptomyces sp. NPDC096354]
MSTGLPLTTVGHVNAAVLIASTIAALLAAVLPRRRNAVYRRRSRYPRR